MTLVVGRGVRYCEPCQAQLCSECSRRGGQHRPGCGRALERRCRLCQAPMARVERNLRYCPECRNKPRCYHCEHLEGTGHSAACPVPTRGRRTPLPYQGVIDAETFLAVYRSQRDKAMRTVRRVAGPDAEDVVQQVALYLWRRLDTLKHLEPGLFFKCVWHEAVKVGRRSAWRRRAVALDLADLADLERERARMRYAVEARA